MNPNDFEKFGKVMAIVSLVEKANLTPLQKTFLFAGVLLADDEDVNMEELQDLLESTKKMCEETGIK